MNATERKILKAIRNEKNTTIVNTVIRKEQKGQCGEFCMEVYLHGYLIAQVWKNHISFSARGWQTRITKSRINLILSLITTPTRLTGSCVTKTFDPPESIWQLHVGRNKPEPIDISFWYTVSKYDGELIRV